jgi:CO/xanthine dehydrogenase FAD-binding subunit
LNEALGTAIPALAECIAGIASPQIRQAATVGGNLLQAKRCWFYRNDFPCFKRRGGLAPCYAIEGDHRFYHAAIDGHRCQAVTPSDLASLFLALDATVTITGAGGARSVPMAAFYTGPGESVVRAGELLTAIDLPASVLARRCRVEKLALWQGDFASASVALSARIDTDGLWREIRLVLGAMAPTPWRARGTERGLEGKRVDAAMLRGALDRELRATAHPLKNNAWKLEAVGGLAEIAVERMAGA